MACLERPYILVCLEQCCLDVPSDLTFATIKVVLDIYYDMDSLVIPNNIYKSFNF